jgi:hypothetical protein
VRSTHSNAHSKFLYRLCGFIFVSRKTYAEARLLPSQLNEFTVDFDRVSHLVSMLEEKLLCAIGNICITQSSAFFSSWDPLHELQEMKGLKRVVITGGGFSETGKSVLMKMIRACGELAHIEVVFDLPG